MRVLITGHNGYIGAVMAPFMKKAGHEVVGMDSMYFDGCHLWDDYERPDEVIQKDIRDVTAADLEGFDAIAHLAALSNDPLGNLNPSITYDINEHASVTLAKAAKEAGVPRFLYSSSCSVYGAASPEDFLDETAAFNPVTAYGKSKVQAEAGIKPLAGDGFSPTYMRNATVYGLSPQLRADLVVNNLVGYAFTTGEVLIKSDGTPWRPLVHVEDVCRAFVAVMEAPIETVHDQAFNVGQDRENYQVRDVATFVESTVPNSKVEYAPGGEPDTRCYRANFGKIRETLPSFQPQWDVPKGVVELYEAYRDRGLKLEDLEGARFQRIRRITNRIEGGELDKDLRWVSVAPKAH